jgi:S-formylglutathione hydrolase FrmB
MIDKTYSIYTDLVYNKFEPESQHKYYDYLHTEIQNKSLSQFIQIHPIIKHPFVDGETKLSLAKHIVDLYDDMMSKEYPNTYHKI